MPEPSMKADLLRKKFLEFFKTRKHRIVESDSLVPADDPTVLFTPAGMNQFKREFLGYNSGFSRAATAQRCLRTDDLDKVGKTAGHHTFFEMLGNFSFGDYFKQGAIAYAWEFLTRELGIDQDKLWVSVYKDDDEAYKIWKDEIKLNKDKIIKLGDKENFWPSEAKEKGPNGPCGPCSEIFFDFGKGVGCGREGCSLTCNCGKFVEIWNLVFTQFNRKDAGILEPLPKKNIDTGMGLERLAAVMQGVPNNFQSDLFAPLVKEITRAAGANKNSLEDIYALSDHIRAIVFAIYDGILPSNEKRGYVVRKIIRSSTLHLRALGIKEAFLYKLVPLLAGIMKEPYPELLKRKENIAAIILAEERNFISTLDSSNLLLTEKFNASGGKPDPEQAGMIAFQLYDTFGIPLELSLEWTRKNGLVISETKFNQELAEQKNRSKLQSMMKGDVFSSKEEKIDFKATEFLGYDNYSVKAKILGIFKGGQQIKKAIMGEEVRIILAQTVFYAESGGQVGDRGELVKGKNRFEVLDTQKIGKVILHSGRVKAGSFKKNDLVLASVNRRRRLAIARNHTATHLLQAALRKILGQHVRQQGSLVAEDRLRFDFTHFKDIDRKQLNRIEGVVNEYIMSDYPLIKKQLRLEQARKKGALAFFAEKYEPRVRVVEIGDISLELCAGTHLGSTSQVCLFKIIHEGAVASGIRRIEATTGNFAYSLVKNEEDIIADVALALNVPAFKITQDLERKLSKLKELEKQLSAKKLDAARNNLENLISDAETIGDFKFIYGQLQDADMNILRKSVDLLKQKLERAVILLTSINAGRVLLVLGITENLCQEGKDAQKLINDIAVLVAGSGGGRKDFAQAGGSKPEDIERVFLKLRELLIEGSK
jgi:alanyl-tRNA synthetase